MYNAYGENYDYDDNNYIIDIEVDEDDFPTLPKKTKGYRKHLERKKSKRLCRIIEYGYAPHRGYLSCGYENGEQTYIVNYIKYPKNSNCQRWMKRQTSKRARKIDLPNGNRYRRVLDYWWTLY